MILCAAKVGENMSNHDKKLSIEKKLNNNVEVRYFKTIDSTNNEAKKCYKDLKDSPILFIADHQTNGRGRLGRSFYSPQNTGLYMSLLINVKEKTTDIVCMTTATAVCVAKAIEKLTHLSPMIKWVNDIYINNKKVCGILCEAITAPETSTVSAIVIGIGINITTDVFPLEIKDIAGALHTNIDPDELCAEITNNIIGMFSDIQSRKFIDEYKARSMVLNKEINYIENTIIKTATAVDIDKNGGLIINENGVTKTLSTGEISIRLKGN